MKALVGSITFGMVLAITAGCEGNWQFGSKAAQWDESGNWMDVSGTYVHTAANTWLVSDFSQYAGPTITSETLFTTASGQTFYSGMIDVANISPTSITGFIGESGTFAVSSAGVVSGGASGSINLTTGAFAITIAAPSDGVPYSITFQRTTGSGSQQNSGGTGDITTFTVAQSGNVISITDNNGAIYKGNIALTETNTVGGTNVVNLSAIYQYDCSGVSAAGLNVELVGNFEINGSITVGTNLVIATQINGTWIEKGGKTGHILGVRE